MPPPPRSSTPPSRTTRRGGGDLPKLLEAAVTALGGSERAGQQEMAAAVDRAAERGEHLMVQAGTGTGKSLAYLVPLAAHAVRTSTPVVVSTATLALQRQIAERDLPRLSSALSPLLGRQLTSAVVKGRSQYVCVNKLAGGMGEPADADTLFEVAGADGPTSSLGRQVRRAREWAEQSETGDRDDLVPGVPDRAWRQVSVTARECLGAARCPMAGDCHVEQGRARAREVDVVVTNHALLAVDAVEGRAILPEHDVVVIDEAHELAARVTSVAAVTLSGSAVAAAAASARRHGGSSETLEVSGDDLVAVLADAEPGRLAAGLGESLGTAVAAVRDAARSAISSLSDGGSGGSGGRGGGRGSGGGGSGGAGSDGPDAGGVSVARAGLTEVFETAERLVSVRARGADVAWVERTERGGAPTSSLHVAPLSVAGVLRERLFGTRTVVMTSATLALGGAFTSSAANVGMTVAPTSTAADDDAAGTDAEPDPTTLRALEVESPFDYPRQGILYVAAHLPPPGRTGTDPAVLDELEALITAAGGRTLALFSSRRAAESAAEAMRPRLAMPVLCQGDDATPTLVRDFLADEETCLFGTLSLWQGVDAPGPACQLVVIDRIPFPRPDDPLTAARTEAVGRAGGNGFMAVAATHAALLLAQGSGRLVRSSDDRGVVAVLDPRLANARYGAFLTRSMPPLWPTADRAVALGALQRLAAAAGSAS